MQMIISYHWDRVVVNYKKELENVDYNYIATITEEDIEDYLMPSILRNTDDEALYRRAIRHTLSNIYVDYDKLEEDEYFVAFIKQRYYEQAEQEMLDYYDED